MDGFFSALFGEFAARRRRLRAALGDRGASLLEFATFTGLAVGSAGLLIGDWMPAAAPWGFVVPAVFIAGYVLLDARRQAAQARGDDAERVASDYDWLALGWGSACALLGAAAFVIAWSAQPPNLQKALFDKWTPPESAVSVDISP
jgi:hypothetical protein